jgi:ribosomal subunit interface protein
MISEVKVTGVHMEPDEKLKKYAIKKISAVDKYLPRHARKSAHAEVLLIAEKKGGKKYTAEVTLHLPNDVLNVKESTINIYACIDIVETKLKNQVRKYKELHATPRLYRRLVTRFRRSPAA